MSSDRDHQEYYLFRGYPVPLFWYGWRTDTHQLDRARWTLHIKEEEDLERDTFNVHIAAVSPDGNIALAGKYYPQPNYFGYKPRRYRGAVDSEYLDQFYRNGVELREFTTPKAQFAFQDVSQILSWKAMERFNPYQTVTHKLWDARDFKMFKRYEEAVKEIYVPSNSVEECFSRILQLQWPEQKKLLLPDSKPIARILSI